MLMDKDILSAYNTNEFDLIINELFNTLYHKYTEKYVVELGLHIHPILTIAANKYIIIKEKGDFGKQVARIIIDKDSIVRIKRERMSERTIELKLHDIDFFEKFDAAIQENMFIEICEKHRIFFFGCDYYKVIEEMKIPYWEI